jgi:dienelactone hydrolase
MRFTTTLFCFFWIILGSLACQSPRTTTGTPDLNACFRVQKSARDSKKWILLLPGSSGLRIFGDTTHYYNAAQRLTAAGYIVLLVDYKKAYRILNGKIKGDTGQKIKWVTSRAIEWAWENGHWPRSQGGRIVAWSLGGEGVWPILNDPAFIQRYHVEKAALYYPSNQSGQKVGSETIPFIVFCGLEDRITPAQNIRETCPFAPAECLFFYPDAHHGFDISSLKKAKTVRFPPFFGKKHIFKWEEKAVTDSWEQLLEFL